MSGLMVPAAVPADAKLLHHNPVTGKSVWYVEDGEDWLIYEEMDCEPVVDLAHAFATEVTPGKDLRHVGEIPLVFVDQAHREGWLDDKKQWRKFLDAHPRLKVHKG